MPATPNRKARWAHIDPLPSKTPIEKNNAGKHARERQHGPGTIKSIRVGRGASVGFAVFRCDRRLTRSLTGGIRRRDRGKKLPARLGRSVYRLLGLDRIRARGRV